VHVCLLHILSCDGRTRAIHISLFQSRAFTPNAGVNSQRRGRVWRTTIIPLRESDGVTVVRERKIGFRRSRVSSQILLRRTRNSPPKHWAPNRHIDLIEWVHDGLDPRIIHLKEEVLSSFFSSGGGGIKAGGGIRR
jgi:hypothetical protein